MKAARSRWRKAQPQWQSDQLVFIDETGLNTKMARLYGRSLRSQRCVAAVPHGHWQTSTFLAALRRLTRIDAQLGDPSAWQGRTGRAVDLWQQRAGVLSALVDVHVTRTAAAGL